jgi:hypothetical protein
MNEPSPNGRSLDGRFGRGNKAAAGNPRNRRTRQLRREWLAAVTLKDLRRVSDNLLKASDNGDVLASRVWLEFVLGKPVQGIEVSDQDGQPMGIEVLMAAVARGLEAHPEASEDVAAELMKVSRAHRAESAGDADEPD